MNARAGVDVPLMKLAFSCRSAQQMTDSGITTGSELSYDWTKTSFNSSLIYVGN